MAFDLKQYRKKMLEIINPPPVLSTNQGLPNLAEKIKQIARIKK